MKYHITPWGMSIHSLPAMPSPPPKNWVVHLAYKNERGGVNGSGKYHPELWFAQVESSVFSAPNLFDLAQIVSRSNEGDERGYIVLAGNVRVRRNRGSKTLIKHTQVPSVFQLAEFSGYLPSQVPTSEQEIPMTPSPFSKPAGVGYPEHSLRDNFDPFVGDRRGFRQFESIRPPYEPAPLRRPSHRFY